MVCFEGGTLQRGELEVGPDRVATLDHDLSAINVRSNSLRVCALPFMRSSWSRRRNTANMAGVGARWVLVSTAISGVRALVGWLYWIRQVANRALRRDLAVCYHVPFGTRNHGRMVWRSSPHLVMGQQQLLWDGCCQAHWRGARRIARVPGQGRRSLGLSGPARIPVSADRKIGR
jgi:hypothetical protein